jgi:hypothetical protein
MKVKRPIEIYIFHILWIALTTFKSFDNTPLFAKILWIAALVISVIQFANAVIRKHYFELHNNKLLINKDFFIRRYIEVDEIEKIKIEPGPFKYSTILLKNKTKVKFNDSYTDNKELKELMNNLNVQFE